MRDDDRIRILRMIDAAQTVEQFVSGKTREDLDTDRLLLFAVLRAIEVSANPGACIAILHILVGNTGTMLHPFVTSQRVRFRSEPMLVQKSPNRKENED